MIPRLLLVVIACLRALAWQVGGSAITAESNLVLVNATVLDEHNSIRTDLRVNDIRLFEDDVPVQVNSLSLEDVPVSTVILLDVSGSMRDTIEFERDALERFLARRHEGDEFCLVLFSGDVGAGCQFHSDADEIRAVARRGVPGGNTALIDALIFGFDKIREAHNPRRVILVLSDARDTRSRYRWKDARRRALETTAMVYAVSRQDYDESGLLNAPELHEIVRNTGGRFLANRRRLALLSDIDELEVRLQYVISYTPPPHRLHRNFHTIKLELTDDLRKHHRAYWRRGYFASSVQRTPGHDPAQHQ